jgi:putative oxidoreductase
MDRDRCLVAEQQLSVYWPKFGWTMPGYEYPLMWGLIAFALALGGGGPYSLDRKLGREL